MKPLQSLLIFPFLISSALGLSRVAVPNASSSLYENQTFNHNVIEAFARLNGPWSPEIRSFTTLEDLASILSGQSAVLSNATHVSRYTDYRSHHVHSPSARRHHHHGSSLDHRSSHSRSNLLATRAKEPKAVFAHFMVSLPSYMMLLLALLPYLMGLRCDSSRLSNYLVFFNCAVSIVSGGSC